MNNLFLTGEKRIGKSTLLKDALEKMEVSIGGYITDRKIQAGRTSFITKSLNDPREEYTIATINSKEGTREIFRDSFELGLRSILDESLETKDLTVLDELGFMENDLDLFTSKVEELLDSERAVFGVLKDHDCEFLNKIRARDDVIILEITRENRDSILAEIIEILEGFGLDQKRLVSDGAIISLVGGGGKTTTIKGMASIFKDDGARVLWTTSTAIMRPSEKDYDRIFIGDIPSSYRPRKGSITVYGEYEEAEKLRSKDLVKIEGIINRKIFDLVLIEADGAKRKPIKAPGSHEPVISKLSTVSLGVIGMDAIGQNIDSIAHRPDLLKGILEVGDDHILEYRDLIKLALDEKGLFKDAAGRKILLLNKVRDEELELASEIQKALKKADIEVYIGPYRSI